MGAQISDRKAARVRKEAILSGTYDGFDPLKGQALDPSWEKLRSIARIHAPQHVFAMFLAECSKRRKSKLMHHIGNL